MPQQSRILRTCLSAVLVIVLLGITLCAQSYLNPPFTVDYDITQWIRTRAIPFRMGSSFDPITDLSGLRELVGDARMVAVGEATHGTHEFFEIKAQMFRYLAEEMGFTLFAMESDAAGCTRINRFLATGEGDLFALMNGLLGNSQTVEFLNLFGWMRTYNQSVGPDRQLRVQGLDMQRSADSMDLVADFLREVYPTGADELLDGYEAYRPHEADWYAYAARPVDEKEVFREGLQAVYDWIALHREECEQVAGVIATHDALYNARIVLQNETLSSQVGHFATAGASRDRFMAENALWWLETCGPESRMVMSNHNMHVSRNFFGLQNTGAYLSQALSDDLIVFGTTFYDGSFLVMGEDPSRRFQLEEIQTALPRETSYEYAFRSTWIPRFFLDLREVVPGSAGADWLLETRPFHGMYNAAFTGYRSPEHVSLGLLFDVVIHFQATTPAWMLPTGA